MADEQLQEQPKGGVIDRPSFVKKDSAAGLEGIGIDDIRLPRLAIAQGLSPQITPGGASFIQGLQLFDLFNDLTSEIYGHVNTTLQFVPVRRDVKRIQFKPRSEGGGVIDMDVPANDPRTRWTTNEDGKRIPPAATKYVEFVVLLVRDGKAPEPIVLSIKDTNKWSRAAAINLTSFIALRKVDIYAGLYEVTSKAEKNDQGTFGVYAVRNVRNLDDPTQTNEEWEKSGSLYRMAEAFHQSLKGKKIVTEREPGEDDVAFDEPQHEAAHAGPPM